MQTSYTNIHMEMIAGFKHQVTAWLVLVYAMGIGILDMADEVVQLLAAVAALILMIINIMIKVREWRDGKKAEATQP